MAGNQNSGTKSELARAPKQDWVRLKIEFLGSDTHEVKEFLESKGIEVNDYSYKCTRGWRRDKLENLKKAMYLAEKQALRTATEALEEKIKRRSNWWKTIQQSIVAKFVTKDAEGKMQVRQDMDSQEIFFLTKSYETAVKGERLEDGQPTVVEKIDQITMHTHTFQELSDEAFDQLESEMSRALSPSTEDEHSIEHPSQDRVPASDGSGGNGETVPTQILP